MAKPFLHAGQHRSVIPGLDMDHPVGPQTCLRDSRGEEIAARQAPQHLSPRPRRDARPEQGRSSPVDRAVSAARYLVQGPERQPAAGKTGIDRGDPEGKHAAFARGPSLDPFDPVAQGLKGGLGPHDGDDLQCVLCSFFVLVWFLGVKRGAMPRGAPVRPAPDPDGVSCVGSAVDEGSQRCQSGNRA